MPSNLMLFDLSFILLIFALIKNLKYNKAKYGRAKQELNGLYRRKWGQTLIEGFLLMESSDGPGTEMWLSGSIYCCSSVHLLSLSFVALLLLFSNETLILGSLSNQDGDRSKTVTWKNKFSFTLFQTPFLLFHHFQFVKCWRIFLSLKIRNRFLVVQQQQGNVQKSTIAHAKLFCWSKPFCIFPILIAIPVIIVA